MVITSFRYKLTIDAVVCVQVIYLTVAAPVNTNRTPSSSATNVSRRVDDIATTTGPCRLVIDLAITATLGCKIVKREIAKLAATTSLNRSIIGESPAACPASSSGLYVARAADLAAQ